VAFAAGNSLGCLEDNEICGIKMKKTMAFKHNQSADLHNTNLGILNVVPG